MNKNTRENLLITCTGLFLSILCSLPFIASLLYSIDDYHLWNVYDINLHTMGYNFYSTGRIIEGILSEMLFHFNIQPVNRPVGILLLMLSFSLLGTFCSEFLNITSLKLRILICILFVLNPFVAEIYYYSTVSVYSGFAVLFLYFGIMFSQKYCDTKLKKYLFYTIIFYYLSLGTYQIFYPIVGFLLILKVITGLLNRENTFENNIKQIVIYCSAFILFYVSLKVMFWLWPPTLHYTGTDFIEFAQNLFTSSYWKKLLGTLRLYYGNNLLHSNIIFISINIFLTVVLIMYLILHRTKRALGGFFISVIYMLLGPVFCLGLGLTRLEYVSGRTFTSYSIYITGLLIIAFHVLSKITYVKGNLLNNLILIIFCVSIFVNGSIIGRSANNVMRLNNLEANLANRIIYRMESFPEFTGYEPLIIYGVPKLEAVSGKGIGNFLTPASAEFSKVFLFNEVSGYSFSLPSKEQYQNGIQLLDDMDTWPGDDSVKYYEGCFIIRLYY